MLNIRTIEVIEMPVLKRTLLIDSLCECPDAIVSSAWANLNHSVSGNVKLVLCLQNSKTQ